jgi:hypothetical protein
MDHYNSEGNVKNVTGPTVFSHLIKLTLQLSLVGVVQVMPNKATNSTVKKNSILLTHFTGTAERD